MHKTTGKQRRVASVTPAKGTAEILHLKLFLRRSCRQCSETAVAEEVRQLHHVRRVEAHPGRHEIDIWTINPQRSDPVNIPMPASRNTSGATYTTLGYGNVVLPRPWRLAGVLESLTSVPLLGWSAAFFFTDRWVANWRPAR
jgi:hypothetical protein